VNRLLRLFQRKRLEEQPARGLGIALVVARLIERLVPGVRSAEPLTFAAMIVVLVSAALLASAVPARRASRIEPMRALRQE